MGHRLHDVVEVARLEPHPEEEARVAQVGVRQAGVLHCEARRGHRQLVGAGHQLQVLAAAGVALGLEVVGHAQHGRSRERLLTRKLRVQRSLGEACEGGVEAYTGRADQADARHGDLHGRKRPTTSVPLLPPKPNALVSAMSTSAVRASFGT